METFVILSIFWHLFQITYRLNFFLFFLYYTRCTFFILIVIFEKWMEIRENWIWKFSKNEKLTLARILRMLNRPKSKVCIHTLTFDIRWKSCQKKFRIGLWKLKFNYFIDIVKKWFEWIFFEISQISFRFFLEKIPKNCRNLKSNKKFSYPLNWVFIQLNT